MRANELQGCQTAKIAAASKQCSLSRRHMWGFIFKTSGSFFFLLFQQTVFKWFNKFQALRAKCAWHLCIRLLRPPGRQKNL